MMRDWRITVQRIKMAETELLIVDVTQIHVFVIRVESDGSASTVSVIPELIESFCDFLVWDELLIGHLH